MLCFHIAVADVTGCLETQSFLQDDIWKGCLQMLRVKWAVGMAASQDESCYTPTASGILSVQMFMSFCGKRKRFLNKIKEFLT